MVVGAAAADFAALFRIGSHGDGVLVQREVGHIACSFNRGEGVGRLGGDFFAVLGPVSEGVAFGSRGLEGHFSAVVVGAAAADFAAFFRIGSHGDFVAVQLEVGDVFAFEGGHKLVGGLGRNLVGASRPVDEGVALGSRGRQGDGGAVVVGAAAGDFAAFFRIGSHGDVVAVQHEVGHIFGILVHGEAEAQLAGDFLAALGPINKGVAFVGLGGQGDGGAVFVNACAGDGAALSRVGRGADGVLSVGQFDGLRAAHGVVGVLDRQFLLAVIHHAQLVGAADVAHGVHKVVFRGEGNPFAIAEEHRTNDFVAQGAGFEVEDLGTEHPSVVKTIVRYVFPCCTINANPASVGIAHVCAARSGISGTAGIVNHHPNVLGGVENDRFFKLDGNELIRTRKGHHGLANGIGGSRRAIVVDGHRTPHKFIIIEGNSSKQAALVGTGGKHDAPIERSTAKAYTGLIITIVIIVPVVFVRVDGLCARRFGIGPAETDAGGIHDAFLVGDAFEQVARLVDPNLARLCALARGELLRHTANVGRATD